MKFDYGKNGLEIDIDPTWDATIFHPKKQEIIKNPVQAITHSIENPIGSPPLRDIIKEKKEVNNVCIVVNDATRPVPSHLILEGLIKKLNELYEKIMDQKGYLLSVIRGIPYYYRIFGYEYISSLDERIMVPASKMPNKKPKNVTIRKANLNDIPFIESKYNQFHKKFYISNKFDPESFKFKHLNKEFNTEVRSTYIFDINNVSSNYFSLGMMVMVPVVGATPTPIELTYLLTVLVGMGRPAAAFESGNNPSLL